MFKSQILTPLVAALLLAGCASVATTEPHALPAVPAAFKTTQTSGTAAASQIEWWRGFADPQLDALTERALAHNTSIQQAAARLAQARAMLRNANADRLPQVGASVGAGRQGGDASRAAGTNGSLYTAGVNLSYEVDVIGRLSKANDAASLDAQARESLLQAARLLVQSDVAQAYFSLRALDAERALMRDNRGRLSRYAQAHREAPRRRRHRRAGRGARAHRGGRHAVASTGVGSPPCRAGAWPRAAGGRVAQRAEPGRGQLESRAACGAGRSAQQHADPPTRCGRGAEQLQSCASSTRHRTDSLVPEPGAHHFGGRCIARAVGTCSSDRPAFGASTPS